jgi:hypothetical protein
MFSPYKISIPTSAEPTTGWYPNSRVVWRMPVPQGFEIRKGSFRLNGRIEFLKSDGNGGWMPTVPENLISLNPNAGISSVIRQTMCSLDGRIVETINEYPRMIAASNEASWFQVDECTTADSMLEVMSFPSDDFEDGTNPYVKNFNCQGAKFPIDPSITIDDETFEASELPFSLDLDIALNSATIPSSKVQLCELSINFQDATKSLYSPVAGTNFSYSLKNLQVRYICDPESKTKQPLVLEVKNNAFIGSLLNQVSTLDFSPSTPFDRVWAVFLKEGWDNSYTDFTKDYLLTQAIKEEVNMFEVKLNGQSDLLKFPLRFKQTEMSYSYLLCHQKDEEAESLRHGLTYGKLAAVENKTGYGLGCPLSQMMPPSTQVQFNINLKTAPTTPYRVFFYTKGFVEF